MAFTCVFRVGFFEWLYRDLWFPSTTAPASENLWFWLILVDFAPSRLALEYLALNLPVFCVYLYQSVYVHFRNHGAGVELDPGRNRGGA